MIKLALAGFLTLTLLAGIALYWMMPSTQLIDASGAELTTGLPTPVEVTSESFTDELRAPELFHGEEFREIKRLMDTGNHRPAKDRLVALLETSERDGETCILLSECCRELEEHDEAVDYGLKAIELLPDVGRAHHVYAKALADKMVKGGNQLVAMMLLPKWKDELAKTIELDPANVDARIEQLTFFTYMPALVGGDLDRAIELCAELEGYDPARGKLWMARAYQQKKELDRAIQLCEEGLEAFPEDGMFGCTLGGIRAQQESFEEADVAFEKAKQLGKGEAYYRTLIAQANMHVDHELDREKAIALMDEYLAYHPDAPMMTPNAMVLFKKGQALEQLGKTAEARQAYTQCLQEEPKYTQAQDALDELDPSGE